MKHFSQTIIHNKLFLEDDLERISAIYLSDGQKRYYRLKKNVAGIAVRLVNFGKKKYLTLAKFFSISDPESARLSQSANELFA